MSTIRLITVQSIENLRQRSLRSDCLHVAIGRPWVARNGVAVHLPPRHRDLLIALLARRQVQMSDLVDALYSDDPDGGPDDPGRVISHGKYDLKSIGLALGLHIGHRGTAWHVAEFAS